MSSLRPVMRPMRRCAGRAVPGSSRVRSLVRYRMIGRASLVSEVKTSSPGSPSPSTTVGSKGSMISGRKWSSQMWLPSWVSTASPATPGPMTSESP